MSPEIILKGTPVCRGIAIGKPYFFSFIESEIPEYSINADQIDLEIARYRDALEKSREDITSLHSQLAKMQNREGAAILDAQLLIMQDMHLTFDIEEKIKSSKKNVESLFQDVINIYKAKFNAISNSFFRERFNEIQDISRRVMGHLKAASRHSFSNLPPDSIIFTKELSASDTAEAHVSSAGAFVTRHGGINSHAAIVAKARGTPYVSNIPFEELECRHHNTVIVDGRTGEIIFSPHANTLTKYQQLRSKLQSQINKLEIVSTLKAETFDGYRMKLSANIEMASELEMLHQHGGQGVGLFRSEYICLSKNAFPSEEEQYQIYKDLVEKMKGLPIVIRTFDVGGDKGGPMQQNAQEVNPFLGCRAIRFLLKEKSIFRNQLRAILRASAHGEVSIMFPMVSTLSELIEAKQMLNAARLELEQANIPTGKLRIGCMIEVPSAAMIADMLAKECDFLSIGTNDLVQYALAVDRSNQDIGSLYTPVHPSVIRMIKLIVQEANHHGIPVSICGEMAADPRFTPLLLGLGVHELSVSTRYIPIVKNTIRSMSIITASLLAERVLTLTSSSEIQELLATEYRKTNPEDCIYNC